MKPCALCNKKLPDDRIFSSGMCWDCDHMRDIVAQHLHRARVEGLPADLTLREWYEIVNVTFGWHCAYCGKKLGFWDLRLEHFVPISMGGGTTKDNVVPACKHCDSRKKCNSIGQPPGYERVKAYLASL